MSENISNRFSLSADSFSMNDPDAVESSSVSFSEIASNDVAYLVRAKTVKIEGVRDLDFDPRIQFVF